MVTRVKISHLQEDSDDYVLDTVVTFPRDGLDGQYIVQDRDDDGNVHKLTKDEAVQWSLYFGSVVPQVYLHTNPVRWIERVGVRNTGYTQVVVEKE